MKRSPTKEALDCWTNSPFQNLKKCMEYLWRICILMLESKGFICTSTKEARRSQTGAFDKLLENCRACGSLLKTDGNSDSSSLADSRVSSNRVTNAVTPSLGLLSAGKILLSLLKKYLVLFSRMDKIFSSILN